MQSVIIGPHALSTADLLRVYNAAAEKCGRPGVGRFLDAELGEARVVRLLAEARMTLVTAANQQGWSLLPYAAVPLRGDARTLTKRYAHPHPPGTKRAKLWAMVPDGGTIADYIAVRGEPTVARTEITFWARHQDWLIVHHYRAASS